MKLGFISAGLAAIGLAASSAGAQVPKTAAPRVEAAQPAPAATPVTAAAPTAAPQLTAEDVSAWLDGFVPLALQRGGLPGAMVVVVKDGQVLAAKGYGHADVEKKVPVDPDRTLFRPGSVSKLFTWTAVMQLVEAGKLDLDADVNRYLDFKIPEREGKPITLRHILTHTPGFEETGRGLITGNPANNDLEAALKRWVPTRVFEAGTTPAYSNYATALAGYIVQRVSGQSFDSYVEANIFAPLGMENSSFRQPLPARLAPMMAKGYAKPGESAGPFEIVNMPPAGSLSSTGTDMARFMIAHLQKGQYGENRILKPETAAQMHDTPTAIMAPLLGMRLGFYDQNINGRRIIGHGGDTTQFHTLLSLFIDDNVGLYQSVNGSGVPNGGFRQMLLEAFADRYFPAPRTDAKVDPKVAAAQAQQIAGHYVMARGSFSNFLAIGSLIGQLKLSVNPDGTISLPLLVDASGQPRKYRAIGNYLWQDVNGHDRIGAKVVDGRVQFLSTDMISPIIVLKPAPATTNNAWLIPALIGAAAAIILTILLWPVAWLVRRRFGQPLVLPTRQLAAHRAVRVGGLILLAAVGCWAVVLSRLYGNMGFEKLMGMEGFLLFTQGFTAFAVVGGVVLAAWNMVEIFRGEGGWARKLWSVVLLLSFGMILWVAWFGRLMTLTTNY